MAHGNKHRVASVLLAAILALGLGSLASQAKALEKRVALVIGNSAYRHSPELRNPGNDAGAVAEALTGLGFKVVKGIDLEYGNLAKTIRDFSREVEGADVVLFYYAGHGLQVGGANYIVPIDAKLTTEIDLSVETVQLDAILSIIGRVKGTKIVILDACRDNPFAVTLARALGSTRAINIGKGLAQVKSESGMLIAFATEPGNVALDGDGKHSPFTEALLKHMSTPDVDLQLMMRRVRADVIERTQRRQTPWESSSLTTAFMLKETPKPPPLTTPAAVPKSEPKMPELPAINTDVPMIEAWKSTQAIGTCGSYEGFRKTYPNTLFATLAEEWMRSRCKDGKPVEAVKPPVAPPPVASIPKATKETAEPPRAPAAVQPTLPKTVAVPPLPPKAVEPEPKPRKLTKTNEAEQETRNKTKTQPNADTVETRNRPSVKEDSAAKRDNKQGIQNFSPNCANSYSKNVQFECKK